MIQIPHRLFIKSILNDELIPWQVTRAVFLARDNWFLRLLDSLAVVFLGAVTTREALSAGHIEVAHRHAEFGRIFSASTGAFTCAQLPRCQTHPICLRHEDCKVAHPSYLDPFTMVLPGGVQSTNSPRSKARRHLNAWFAFSP